MNTESQTDRITQLEAACALKTDLLRAVRYSMDREVPFPSLAKITEAINDDSGRALLDRLNKAETELVIANQSIEEMQSALGKLKDRLQAVEAERDRFRDERNIAEGLAGQNDLELRQIKSERDRYKAALKPTIDLIRQHVNYWGVDWIGLQQSFAKQLANLEALQKESK